MYKGKNDLISTIVDNITVDHDLIKFYIQYNIESEINNLKM